MSTVFFKQNSDTIFNQNSDTILWTLYLLEIYPFFSTHLPLDFF